MTLANRHEPLLTPEAYLASEAHAPHKREFLNGVVYALAGGTTKHSRLATNIAGALLARLRGKRCRPFNSDMLIRVRHQGDERFYYPDVSVVCDPNPLDSQFQDHPVFIFEVLSSSTERIDLGEKRDAYLRIPGLAGYVTVSTDDTIVTIWRRSDSGIKSQRYSQLDEMIPLPEIECELPMAEIFDGAV